jgi:hypothetical protein
VRGYPNARIFLALLARKADLLFPGLTCSQTQNFYSAVLKSYLSKFFLDLKTNTVYGLRFTYIDRSNHFECLIVGH